MNQKKTTKKSDNVAKEAAEKDCEQKAKMNGNRDGSGVLSAPSCDCDEKQKSSKKPSPLQS